MHLLYSELLFTNTFEAGLNALQCITTVWYFYLGEQMLGVLTTRSELGCSVTGSFYDSTLLKCLIKDSAHMLNRSRKSLSLKIEDMLGY